VLIDRKKYKEADPERYVKYVHPSQKNVEPALSGRLAYLCQVKGETVTVTRGCVTSAEQKAAGDALLAEHPDYYRDAAEAVRKMTNGKITSKDPMMASAPGDSNHEFKQADDIPDDDWFRSMTNAQLAPYGLYKPMSYEPWHVQVIETKGVPKAEIKKYFLDGGGEMDDISLLQTAMKAVGLYTKKIDGDNGAGTKGGAEKLLPIVLKALDLPDPRELQKVNNEMKTRLNDIRVKATL
jgi:hypothetical protein